ncbi:MAG: CPBP family intramembrane glutamic endopeptidase [Telluria sp.]
MWSALLLALAFAALRACGTLGPAAWRGLLPAGFVLMAATPWLMLDQDGRRGIGLAAASDRRWYPVGILAGAAASLLCFGLGLACFGKGNGNWYVSIAHAYQRMFDTDGMSRLVLYVAFTAPALLFSPVGEEIFFRGVLQRALEGPLGARGATLCECALFGVVHLCHHGLFVSATGVGWLPLSGTIWAGLMFLTALLFAGLRRASGSLFPAMAAHMAFNATMNALILWRLW